jgi:hypothetical protein
LHVRKLILLIFGRDTVPATLIFFACKEADFSNFWKGVIWAAGVARMGYRWKLGKGNKI